MENNNITPNAPKNPFWQPALQYGLWFGLASVLISLGMYLLDIDPFNMSVAGNVGIFVLSASLCATCMYLAVVEHRDRDQGGHISFGQAFMVCLVTAISGSFINSAWEFVLTTIIDPNRIEKMKVGFAQKMGEYIPEDQMDEALSRFDDAQNIFTVFTNAVVLGVVYAILLGLLVSAVGKKDKPYM